MNFWFVKSIATGKDEIGEVIVTDPPKKKIFRNDFNGMWY